MYGIRVNFAACLLVVFKAKTDSWVLLGYGRQHTKQHLRLIERYTKSRPRKQDHGAVSRRCPKY